jgi:hypothetical protein
MEGDGAPPVGERDLPSLYRAADVIAASGQRSFFWWTRTLLALSVLAAVFGVFELKTGEFNWAGLVTFAALAGAAVASFWLVRANPHRRWYDGRAAAESAKSLAWQYMVGGGDFGLADGDPSDARAHLVDRLREIHGQLPRGIPLAALGDDPATSRMDAIRAADADTRRAVYLRDRIEDQERWYTAKAQANEAWRKRWGFAAIALQVAGMAAALLRMIGSLEVDLAGIAATMAVAVAAWTRTKAHAELAEAYDVTAGEVAQIKAELGRVGSEEEWAEFVASAEHAFSREHTLWHARRRTTSPV